MTRATTKSAGLAGGKENGNSGHIDRPAQTAQAIRRLCSDELHGEEDSAPRRDEARRHQRRRVDQGEAPVGESFRREGRTLPKARFHRQRDRSRHSQFALAGRHAQFAAANETTSMHKMSRAPQVFTMRFRGAPGSDGIRGLRSSTCCGGTGCARSTCALDNIRPSPGAGAWMRCKRGEPTEKAQDGSAHFTCRASPPSRAPPGP